MIDIDTSWECIAVYGPVQYSTVQYSTVQYITTVIIDNKKFKIICSNCGSQLASSLEYPQRIRVVSVFEFRVCLIALCL